MAAKEIVVKKYVVRLSGDEREQLATLIRKGKSPAQRLMKARILLKADVAEAAEGWSDNQIIEALETSASMVYRVRKQLVEEGLEAVLSRKPRAAPATPKIFDGEKEAKLIALACSEPPKGRARWTLRLLENKVVELNIVDRASASTIGRTLKKTSLSPISNSNGSFRRRPTAHSLMFAPLEGWRHVKVTDRHTAVDYAHALKDLSDSHFPDARKIILVQDNLNTHKPASLYEAFPAAEARRLVERFEWHYTPKHGSWLDMAESELGVLASQCLDRRIPDKQTLIIEIAAWEEHRNVTHAKANWQFTTADARIKLKHLYPSI